MDARPPSTLPPGDALEGASLATVRRILAELVHLEGALLPILHGVQDALGHVPRDVVPLIAAALNLSRAEVHGVVTYYAHFRSVPAGRCRVQVCVAESCLAMGGEALLAHARLTLGCSTAAPTSADGRHTVEPVHCLGLCALSPALQIGDRPHARMTPERLDAAVAAAGSGSRA